MKELVTLDINGAESKSRRAVLDQWPLATAQWPTRRRSLDGRLFGSAEGDSVAVIEKRIRSSRSIPRIESGVRSSRSNRFGPIRIQPPKTA